MFSPSTFSNRWLSTPYTAFLTIMLAILFSCHAASSHTATKSFSDKSQARTRNNNYATPTPEKLIGWSFSFDNDFLVPGQRDQDYTYGINVRLIGKKTKSHWSSLHTPLNAIDNALGLNQSQYEHTLSSIEFGLFGFTPETLSQSRIIEGDRPYASHNIWKKYYRAYTKKQVT